MDTDKLNNKNKINIYSRSQMKIVLMHRKMDHWTGYSPLAES
jgi:metal-dependent hydrolase (beta-lactamase superfamily II)